MRARTLARPRRSGEAGMALLIAVMMLLMVSAIGLAAIQRAGSQNSIAGHARRTAFLAARTE